MTAETALARLLRHQPNLAASLVGVERAAASGAPLLLIGEAGSGRSTLARALHGASTRSRGPLVELDAASVAPSLFESELFGHRAGAFTGAEAATPGRVGLAAGGTLLLDHVEELPAALQPKLLRLVAEGVYAPLGGNERPADLRFLSIGADDLPERARRGVFREDLFYRLEVLAFRVPPLRERPGDIPGLLDDLLADLASRLGRAAPPLAEESRAWMLGHPWPGNLRQLRNTLERALVMGETEGELVVPLPRAEREQRPLPLLEVEAREIRRALAYTRGHQGRAADLLGISRKALWEKRRRLGIP